MVNRKTIIALVLLLILLLPMSAFAESFTIATNKDIYTLDEKAIILGAIPEDVPKGYAVLIQVTGPGGDCFVQNTLPAIDNSFISRPFRLHECGIGEFTVSAFYADQKTNSTFIISNSSRHADAGSKLELRTLKNVMLQAQEVVNTRVKELIENGYVMPEEIADKYGEGVSEASLTLQAIEFGDATEAKRHMIFALRDLRVVLASLSQENVTRFEQTAEQQAANNGSSDIVGTYNWLKAYYYRLEKLAEKNQVDKENQFNAAALLLANAKHMIDEDNLGGAERNLARVNALLETIRKDLFDDTDKKLTSYTNASSAEDEESARRLTDAANRFEKVALDLLNQTGSDGQVLTKVQDALSLIASARASIQAQDLESARDTLKAAHKIIEEVKDLIDDEDEDDDDHNASTSNSGENSDDGNSGKSSDDGEDSDSGGNDKDDDDEDNEGSNKSDNDEDDQ